MEAVSSGLKQLGLGAVRDGKVWCDEDGKERVGIYADTGLNWQIMSHSLARMGHPLSTAYTTLGIEGLQHSLEQPSCRAVFTNGPLLGTLLKVLPDTPTVSWVIYDQVDQADSKIVDQINEILAAREIPGKAITLDEVKKMGQDNLTDDFGPKPKPSDVFCIMYTSGSTGPPKGVVITHHNAIASLGGAVTHLGPEFRPDDVYIAFLPLAHIMELLVELTFYYYGATVAYGTPKTLTNESVRDCKGDLAAYQPTLLVGVPAIFETIRKGMVKKIHESGAIVESVFNLAYALKKNVPFVGGVIDKVIFAKIKQATGGRLRLAMNGGAKLSSSSQEFLSTTLVTVLQGYGATETCGMAAIMRNKFFQVGSVGVIVPSVEVKLVEYEEAGYSPKHNPPTGEIWLRGDSVISGYYKRPDLTEEAFTKDGWFKTGDIGTFAPDGTLSLIDRIKNLVKLRSGEYLALEKLESVYGSTDIVQNICIYADVDADKPIAIVFPHEGNLRNHLKEEGLDSEAPLSDLIKKDEVHNVILKSLNATGQKGGLRGQELLLGVVLDDEAWTPENGKLTAANKTKRGALKDEFKDQIDKIYQR